MSADDPFSHRYTRRATTGALSAVALIWIVGYLAIEGWIALPDDYDAVLTWDDLLFASVVVLIAASGISFAVAAWLRIRQQQTQGQKRD